jgi:hypothetical protein
MPTLPNSVDTHYTMHDAVCYTMCCCNTGVRSFTEQLTKWKKQLKPEEIRAVEVGCADMYAQIYPELSIGSKKPQVLRAYYYVHLYTQTYIYICALH